jgi:hypothetical protein
MKRLLGIALALASIVFVIPANEAQAGELMNATTVVSASAAGQWTTDRYGRRVYNRRRARTVRRSRIVRFGRRVYRETYAVTYFANGRTNTRLISRVRIG